MLASSLLVVWALLLAPATPERSAALKTMNAGVELARNNQLIDAELQIRKALEHDPSLGEGWLNHGHVLRRMGDLNEAARSFRSGMAVSEGALLHELHYQLGRVLLAGTKTTGLDHDERSKRARGAIDEFLEVTVHQPQRASAWHQLGRAHEFLEDPAKADQAYRRAIEADPHRATAYVGLAFMYLDYGYDAAALAVLKVNVMANDTDAEAWAGLGMGQLRLEKPKEAIDALKKALRIDPEHVRARFALGMAYAEQRDRKSSIEHLTRFLEQASDDVPEFKKHAARNAISQLQDVF
ncbi:MAG: tetratricopeptide repeat protein [Myxococcota bacterium]